ncbi:DMT family transporter [Polaribacter sp. KT 15]|uniref:DMT family transporter n=1 Tax=Polaribacter sp. KT 15 TaxID=1896175 RepID=UPI00090BF8B5|nr:DMT family transporter [Polaribacter sp. KT 15]SHM95578.1 Permease of the drug/metabolite transporter (DMT) superfamily [Polaribacter sp. KT 15]
MNNQQQKWLYLTLLSLVWGSSFILMKKALLGVTPIQLGALRMIFTSIFLLLVAFPSLKKIKKKHYKYIVFTSIAGTFVPGFLFAFAITTIDSSIVSILNSLTPFNTLIFGAIVFGFGFKRTQLYGILIGLIGTLILILKGAALNPDQNYWYAFLIIIASIGYAFNANMVKKYLNDLNALSIVTGNFLLLIVPAFIVLSFTDFFKNFDVNNKILMQSLGYLAILSIVGTGIAKTIYNKLVHISDPVFSSSVTYLIPLVAIFWGVLDGEKLSPLQIFAGVIILFGVYLVNKKK